MLSSMCEIIRDAITFSISLDKNDKFDTGLYIFLISTSIIDFLIRGITIDDLHEEGKTLVVIQRFTIKLCKRTSITCGK